MTRFAAMACVLAGLVACSGSTAVTLKPGEKMNPNSAGQSAPVSIKIFQLKDDAKFNKADFEELWNKADEVLGDDKLGDPKELVLEPRKPTDKPDAVVKKEYKEEDLKPETRYFGVAALFTPDQIKKEDQVKWKKVVLRDEVGSFIFQLDGYELKVVED